MSKKIKQYDATVEGIPVVDARKPMTIEISPDDVKRGANKSPDSCAVARACMRQIGAAIATKVHLSRTYVKFKDKDGTIKWMRFGTPVSIRSEIVGFDRGGTFEPGVYTFAPVQPSVRFGTKRKRYDHRTRGPRAGKPSKRSKPHYTQNVRGHAPAA